MNLNKENHNYNDISSSYIFIRNLTLKIFELYNELCELEINGLDGTNEYEKTLRKLEFFTKREDEFYSFLEINRKSVKNIDNMRTHIMRNGNVKLPRGILACPYDIRVYLIKQLSKDELIDRRICYRLDEANSYNDENNGEFKEFTNSNEFDYIRDKLMLSEIDTIINDPHYKEYKTNMLRCKYDIAFLTKNAHDSHQNEGDIYTNMNGVSEYRATEILSLIPFICKIDKGNVKEEQNTKLLLLLQAYINASMFQINDREKEAIKRSLQFSLNNSIINFTSGIEVFDYLVDNNQGRKEEYNLSHRIRRY